MIIYLIGSLFTLGYLSRIDEEFDTPKFDGFIGSCLLASICLVWPVIIGRILAGINIKPDKEKGGSYGKTKNNFSCRGKKI